MRCAEKHSCSWNETESVREAYDHCSTSRTTVYKSPVACDTILDDDPDTPVDDLP